MYSKIESKKKKASQFIFFTSIVSTYFIIVNYHLKISDVVARFRDLS